MFYVTHLDSHRSLSTSSATPSNSQAHSQNATSQSYTARNLCNRRRSAPASEPSNGCPQPRLGVRTLHCRLEATARTSCTSTSAFMTLARVLQLWKSSGYSNASLRPTRGLILHMEGKSFLWQEPACIWFGASDTRLAVLALKHIAAIIRRPDPKGGEC